MPEAAPVTSATLPVKSNGLLLIVDDLSWFALAESGTGRLLRENATWGWHEQLPMLALEYSPQRAYSLPRSVRVYTSAHQDKGGSPFPANGTHSHPPGASSSRARRQHCLRPLASERLSPEHVLLRLAS